MNPAIPTKPSVVLPQLENTLVPNAVNTSNPNQSDPNKKRMLAILGVIILTITTISGFFLIAKPILFKSSAWSCGEYSFLLSIDGKVSVTNGSPDDQGVQRAELYINNELIQTYDVPALPKGASAVLGTATLPSSTFTWQIKGTSDCTNSGRIESNFYQCQNIKAFSEDGTTELTAQSLTKLVTGTKIRLVAFGTGGSSIYKAVRFTVNQVLQPESSLKTSAGDYYAEYTLSTGTTTFAIKAELKGADGNWY